MTALTLGAALLAGGTVMPPAAPPPRAVTGSLPREVVGDIIHSHAAEIQDCYEPELKKNPSLSGTVQVTFTVDGTGVVSATKVSQTTLLNASVEGCMVGRIRRWLFPKPTGGGLVLITYPWHFQSTAERELVVGQSISVARRPPRATSDESTPSKESLVEVVRGHGAEIQRCYETGLAKDPALAGSLEVSFTIEGSGAVSEAHMLQSTVGNAAVEACALALVKRWRFPMPKGSAGVHVTHRWRFVPGALPPPVIHL